MKKQLTFLLALTLGIITISSVYAQRMDYSGLEVDQQPIRAGQTIQLKFNAAECKLLPDGDPIYAVILTYRSGKLTAYDTMMTPGEAVFTAQFTVPSGADALVFKFVQGIRLATNSQNGYIFPVLDEMGEAQLSTWYSFSKLYSGDYYAGVLKPDKELARQYFVQWFAAQDLKQLSFYDKASALHQSRDTFGLSRHLLSLSAQNNLSEAQFVSLGSMARICPSTVVSSLEKQKKAQFPRGEWYWRPWLDSLKKLPSVSEKLELIKIYEQRNPEDSKMENPIVSSMYYHIMGLLDKTGDIPTLLYCGNIMLKKPRQVINVVTSYRNFLNQMLPKDTLEKECLELARDVMELAREKLLLTENKAPYQSEQMYLYDAKRIYLYTVSAYAAYLYKAAQYDSAAVYAKMTASYFEWKEARFNERYFSAIEKIKPAAEVVEQMKLAMVRGGVDDKLMAMFRSVYAASSGNDLDQVLQELKLSSALHLQDELKEKMIAKPAPNFQLVDMDGKVVSLEALKEKVVFLDFWATWCRPCVSSFPAMQKFVDANKNRQDVVLLFVNTLQSGANRYELVSEFFKDKPYTFDVALDLKDEVVKAFDINGLPTKVIIDKKGVIRFISVGTGDDEQKAVNELQAMIDLAAKQ